jgi:predicted RNase H-like HicB family nuclease
MATSRKSKNSKTPAKALDRPFAPEILQRARPIAQRYQIVLELEDEWWYGHGLEMPNVNGDGRTPEAAVADTREALVAVVAYMLEEGQRPPTPANEGHREEQVNIRLTAEERTLLESRSRARGFRGLSDYVRATALAEGATAAAQPVQRPRAPKARQRPATTKGKR